MMASGSPRVRVTGEGKRLRLRTLGDWDSHPLEALRECAGVALALEKAMFETVSAAREAGCSWAEIGSALGVTKQTAWQRFAGSMRHPITRQEVTRGKEDSDA